MNDLFQQIRILEPLSQTDQIADVWVTEGRIVKIGTEITEIPEETTRRDCRGWVMGPGLVDLYSHSGEPGFEERETLTSLSEAAKAGGFTRLSILPSTEPPADNAATLSLLHQKSRIPGIKLQFWGALTEGVKGERMTELAELAMGGIVGFADGQPLPSLLLLRRLLEYAQPLNQPVALWPVSRELVGNGVMREGINSIRFGVPGVPVAAETAALAGLLELVEFVGTPVHLMRVSTARGVALIADAKSRGLPITASTPWMHLLLDTQAIGGEWRWGTGFPPYNPNLRLEPPLGNPEDRQALVEAVKSGVIDAIAIDHAPYTYEEKTVAFAESPPGAIGLELALPLLWQGLVNTGELSALELWRSLSTNPALCLQQEPAKLAENSPAELTLFNPEETWVVDGRSLKSLAANTPWWGQEIQGKVVGCVS
ncbi:MAG: dihydroorotase [Desertifilum sp.]|nr:dihydroorotase [Oscillatoria laete-virens]MCD8487729.1 dihydroorotase [Desertifilum sp.]MDL5052593.1 dihydroorotase [Oscillatoria laete-virens NRMC-F 0139]